MEIEKILSNDRLARATTGLNAAEFKELLPRFEEAWEKVQKTSPTRRGTERKRKASDKGKLAKAEARLFYVLFYCKAYPTQDVMACLFGITQADACRWVHRLMPLLEQALGEKRALPARRGHSLEEVLAATPGLDFVLDGTERPVRRPKNSERQTELYSGKKKRHTVKNIAVTDANTNKIVGLTQTEGGRRHDKPLADAAEIPWPPKSRVLSDSGLQGYAPENATVLLPFKKPKGKELSEPEKEVNKSLAKIRVSVEHAFSGVKRCNIVSHVNRNFKSNFLDTVMVVACGLHNLRVASRNKF